MKNPVVRERMVTRTIVNNVVLVKAYNNETDEITEFILEIQGNFNDDEIMKRTKARLNGSNYVVLKARIEEKTEKLYGCTEAQFLSIAKEIVRNSKEETEE